MLSLVSHKLSPLHYETKDTHAALVSLRPDEQNMEHATSVPLQRGGVYTHWIYVHVVHCTVSLVSLHWQGGRDGLRSLCVKCKDQGPSFPPGPNHMAYTERGGPQNKLSFINILINYEIFDNVHFLPSLHLILLEFCYFLHTVHYFYFFTWSKYMFSSL